jgi:hypothetical protein
MRTASAFLVGAGVGIVVVAVAAMLLSQPQVKYPKQALECKDETPGKCLVKIDVIPCGLWNAQRCASVLYEAIVIHDKKKIDPYWTIVDHTYKFADNGILITDGTSDVGDCKADDKDKWTFSCKNKHLKFGVYKYTINVIGTEPLDPWVIND